MDRLHITVRYFAWVREAIGISEEKVELRDDNETAGSLAHQLKLRGTGYTTAFADSTKLRCACDQVMVPFETPLTGVKEVAFFPPVTGG